MPKHPQLDPESYCHNAYDQKETAANTRVSAQHVTCDMMCTLQNSTSRCDCNTHRDVALAWHLIQHAQLTQPPMHCMFVRTSNDDASPGLKHAVVAHSRPAHQSQLNPTAASDDVLGRCSTNPTGEYTYKPHNPGPKAHTIICRTHTRLVHALHATRTCMGLPWCNVTSSRFVALFFMTGGRGPSLAGHTHTTTE